MAGCRQSFAPGRCAKRAAARIPAASSGDGPPAAVAAAMGGGDGFDLNRCRVVEHNVHDVLAYSFTRYGRSLAHSSTAAWTLRRFPLSRVRNIGTAGFQHINRQEAKRRVSIAISKMCVDEISTILQSLTF